MGRRGSFGSAPKGKPTFKGCGMAGGSSPSNASGQGARSRPISLTGCSESVMREGLHLWRTPGQRSLNSYGKGVCERHDRPDLPRSPVIPYPHRQGAEEIGQQWGAGVIRLFRSPMSALAWWCRQMARRDGLRAQPCDLRAVSPINGPNTRGEDRLLLLGLIGEAVRKVPAQPRKALLLTVRDGLTPVELAAHLKCSERAASRTLSEGRAMLGRRLKRVGVLE